MPLDEIDRLDDVEQPNPALVSGGVISGPPITDSTGWTAAYGVLSPDALTACLLTITTLLGAIVFGPAAGVPLPDAGGYRQMGWAGTAALPAGSYVYTFAPTVNGVLQSAETGSLTLTPLTVVVNPFPAISLAGIKGKLVGLDSWLAAAARQSVPYDDQRIVSNIPAMLRKFERETTVQIRAVQVITRDDGTYTTTSGGVTTAANGLPIKKEDAYTYYPDDASSYFITNLKTRPVQSVQRVRILFGGTQILGIPPEWYEVDINSGAFQILPVAGSLLFAQYSSSFALLQAGFSNRRFIPHVVHFDYVAGLPVGWETDYEYADLLRVLEEYCALAVLNDIAHLADAGLSGKSISGGGAGESYNYTRFMDRKAELAKSVQDFADTWKTQESPYMLGGL